MRAQDISKQTASSMVKPLTLLFSTLLSLGCAPRSGVVELDPVVFQARATPDGMVVDMLDPELLFEKASRALQEDNFAQACTLYELLMHKFPDHEFSILATYNAGLGYESLQRWDKALYYFQTYLTRAKREKDRVDGLFRTANALAALERWQESGEVLVTLLALRLSVLDSIQAWSRRGRAHQAQGDFAEAERAYLRALDIANQHKDLKVLHGNYYGAMAQFQLGEIYRSLFGSIQFRLPVETMERDLDDKSRLFLKAQSAFLRTIRRGNTEFAVAAGFRVGALYEEFFTSLLAAEYPPELTAEETTIYFDELKRQIRPLVERAVEVYERNIQLSSRAGAGKSEWTEKSRKRLEHLRQLLREDEDRERERRQEQAPLESNPAPPADS